MSFFADKLLGTPYVAHTLEGDREYLSINVDQLDCTTFVETLAALTKAAKAKSPSWYAYASALESIRYHSGHIDGYASRLHYISAWIIENANRGNFTEITSSLPHSEYLTKQSTTCRHTATTTPHSPTAPPLKASGILKPATTATCIHT